MVDVKIKIIKGGILPEFKTEGAVCADCYARLGEKEVMVIEPNCRALVPLGFALQLPHGFEAIIRPRSGLSKDGIDNCIGTIDEDYRGEVNAIVVNNSHEDWWIHNAERICQVAIREVPEVKFEVVEELSETVRGTGGFGSTGIKN